LRTDDPRRGYFNSLLGGRALPFLEGGVTTDPRLAAATATLLQHVAYSLEPLEQSDALAELAHALGAVAGARAQRWEATFSRRGALDYLHENCGRVVTLEELAGATGRDRWSLSHDFRTFYGTSPYLDLTMRRLDAVRHILLADTSLAHAAAAAGFADQSHMTRHFSKTFGLTPRRWLQIAGGVQRG
jgi:AraC-like DNA-binding protein